MFENQPKGLYALALANTGERFGYYTMLAIFALFMQAKFGWTESQAGQVYAIFLAVVYFAPLLGGMLADKIGYGKCVTIGFATMFFGYLGLAIPTGANDIGKAAMFAGLACVSLGTGLFKGNLQVLVGNLYDNPKYSSSRDSAFSLFYMAINIGAMFAPSMAKWITNIYLRQYGFVYDAGNFDPAYLHTLYGAYGLCFGVACISLILSAIIYFACRSWFKHADVTANQAKAANQAVEELTPKQTKDRIVALLLVFAVVIFFWMAFHQNGLTMTFFARDYTAKSVVGLNRLGFDILNLVLIVVSVYSAFSLFQSKTSKGKTIAALVLVGAIIGIVTNYSSLEAEIKILPQIFQQFNPFFVVALTPVSLAVFGYLARKGKEPSAPRKIGYGMLIAACGFLVLAIASFGLPTPTEVKNSGISDSQLVSPDWLISTYLVLTFAELLLSPMGISFVSKVAPPKYKGMMMGGWFVATAIGNYLVAIIGYLWGDMQLWMVWSVLIVCCVLSALFIFSILKRLEKVC